MEAWKHLRAILLLPFIVTVVIPGTILYLNGVDTFGIWQCRIDGTCNHLLDVRSARGWTDTDGITSYNWPGGPFARIRNDGRQILYATTDELYSYADYLIRGAEPWGPYNLYLVDLEPAP